MAKKDLTEGLSKIIPGSRSKAAAPPPEAEETNGPIYDRETFIVRQDQSEKLKDIAYWDRKQLKQVVEDALTVYLQQYLKKNEGNKDHVKGGEIKPRPDEARVQSNAGRKPGSKNRPK